jgi:hypothetical protein
MTYEPTIQVDVAWRILRLLCRPRTGLLMRRPKQRSVLAFFDSIPTRAHRQRQAWRYGLEERPKGFQVIPRRWVFERTFA